MIENIGEQLRLLTNEARKAKAQESRRLREAEEYKKFYAWKNGPSLTYLQELAKCFATRYLPRLRAIAKEGRWHETLYSDYAEVSLALREIPRIFIIFAFNDLGITCTINDTNGRYSSDGGKTYAIYCSTSIDLTWDKDVQ